MKNFILSICLVLILCFESKATGNDSTPTVDDICLFQSGALVYHWTGCCWYDANGIQHSFGYQSRNCFMKGNYCDWTISISINLGWKQPNGNLDTSKILNMFATMKAYSQRIYSDTLLTEKKYLCTDCTGEDICPPEGFSYYTSFPYNGKMYKMKILKQDKYEYQLSGKYKIKVKLTMIQ